MENSKTVDENKKIDRRVIKTKRAICNAFAELISKKNIDDITIKDIADTADINRKTVYNYYSGIHEILDEIENEVITMYENAVLNRDFKTVVENPYDFFNSLTMVLCSNIEFYGSLLSINCNYSLVRKMINSLKQKLWEELSKQNVFPKDKRDLIVTYIVSGMLAAYQNWFNTGRKQSIEDFSKDVSNLVLSGIGAMLNS